MTQPATLEHEEPRLLDLDVVAWRYACLVDAGYTPEDAVDLAQSPVVDLHAACDLLLHGCSGELAVRILL